MSGDWRDASVARAEREGGSGRKPTSFRWTGNAGANYTKSVDTSELLFEADGSRTPENTYYTFLKKHGSCMGKFALVVFFTTLIAFSACWWTCALCTQKLHTLGGQPNSTDAVCLDGEAAGYYVDEQDDKTQWVIWLQGGGICPDLKECQCLLQASSGEKTDSSSLSFFFYTHVAAAGSRFRSEGPLGSS